MNRAVSKRLLWHFAFAASLTLAALFAAAARAQTDTLSHSVDGKQAWHAIGPVGSQASQVKAVAKFEIVDLFKACGQKRCLAIGFRGLDPAAFGDHFGRGRHDLVQPARDLALFGGQIGIA